MKKILTIFIAILLFIPMVSGQEEESSDKKERAKSDSVKTGWTFVPIPSTSYNRDIGFQYGAIVNFYNFGDGSRYPLYDHSLYFEYSRTTKGSGIAQFQYDSDRLIRGIRTALELNYLTEQGLDFYGFNGYQSLYNHAFENDKDASYISRMFFRQERKMIRIRTDFSGNIIEKKLKWFGGIEFYNNKIDTVNIDKLNKGKSEEEKLPYVKGGLYGLYANDWNLLPPDEINGGNHTLLKAGVIYDTRDNEPNPMRGIWTEAIFVIAPSFLSNRDLSYGKLVLTHRQYFTIIPRSLNFAYRLSYQGKIFGDMPSYMLPFVFNSPPNKTRDGLGGKNTTRGVLRNRVVGEGYFYGNLELRWKFTDTRLLNQNFYIALSVFLDGGMVTQQYEVNTANVPGTILLNNKTYSNSDFFSNEDEKPHFGTGSGLHFAVNENFIVALDFSFAFDPDKDGGWAPYIGLDFLF
ncbi:MAG: hypothetical protein AMS27_13305 [Bacteroides sp. SM23_62_1]|nr:MAG: hypothetical protein AMS27_13305 [Bacteroides sp. SM23_62_1]